MNVHIESQVHASAQGSLPNCESNLQAFQESFSVFDKFGSVPCIPGAVWRDAQKTVFELPSGVKGVMGNRQELVRQNANVVLVPTADAARKVGQFMNNLISNGSIVYVMDDWTEASAIPLGPSVGGQHPAVYSLRSHVVSDSFSEPQRAYLNALAGKGKKIENQELFI